MLTGQSRIREGDERMFGSLQHETSAELYQIPSCSTTTGTPTRIDIVKHAMSERRIRTLFRDPDPDFPNHVCQNMEIPQ